MKTPSKTELVTELEGRIISSNATIEAWTTRLIASPAYAFEWSEKAFNAAGAVEVYSQVLGMATSDMAETLGDIDLIERLAKFAGERIRHGAMYPARSTSVQSNLVEQAKLSAWAEVANMLDGRWM